MNDGYGYLSKKLMDDKVAGACIPLALILSFAVGQDKMAAIAALLALAGWMNMGKVSRPVCTVFSVLVCIVSCFHGSSGMWPDTILLYGACIMLYQSVDHKGKLLSRTWCLRAAALIVVLGIAGMYMKETSEIWRFYGTFNTADSAGLFFAVAALSDNSPRRRYLFCVGLGMSGSVLGLISMGMGLLFKKQDWVEDTAWTATGLLAYVCPLNLWFLIVCFLFWCVPEMQACVGKGSEKLGFVPFALSICNPLTFSMLHDWAENIVDMFNKWDWHIFAGIGPGEILYTSGLFQIMTELGIIITILLVICVLPFRRKPAGCAWLVHFLFGAAALTPYAFLLGAGTGMADALTEEGTPGRRHFFILLVISLYMCSRAV